MARSLRLRVFAFFWALLQLAGPGALSVLDGAAARREAADVVAHVEATSGKACQPPHSAECGICRYLSTNTVSDAGVDEPNWPLAFAAPLPEERSGVAPATIAARLHARAPPIA